MNPFIQSACGLVLVAGPHSSTPLMSERMAKAFLGKLQDDPVRILDPVYWDEVVEMTPATTGFNPSSQTVTKPATPDGLSTALAGIASGDGQQDLAAAIADYLAPLEQITQLNCLVLSEDSKKRIDIRLACLSVQFRADAVTIAATIAAAALDLTVKTAFSKVTQVFGSFAAPAKTAAGYRRIYR